MTTYDVTPVPATARDARDLLQDQLAGIDAWNRARRGFERAEASAAAAGRSREARLDLSRRMDVLRREQEALVNRTAQQMRESRELFLRAPRTRAVIAHRNAWFTDKVAAGLSAAGVEVVACVENGADAVGLVVAEQPDLLLVEDRLPMIGGVEVLRQVALFAPRTVSTAQAESDAGIGPLLEAGARTAFTRRVPPADVARDLYSLVCSAAG